MIKRILLTIVMLLLIAYLVAAVTVFNSKPAHQVCRDMELVIKDTLNAGFVTKNEVAAILQKKGIYPVGKKMDRIHTKTLEKELNKHPLINEAQCYKTPSGKLCVEVTQRVPILRINVLPGKEIELIPRVGNHIIYLGKLEHFEDKLGRLKTFYEKGLNQVGWNKYSRISLEFGNQIICTKKKQ